MWPRRRGRSSSLRRSSATIRARAVTRPPERACRGALAAYLSGTARSPFPDARWPAPLPQRRPEPRMVIGERRIVACPATRQWSTDRPTRAGGWWRNRARVPGGSSRVRSRSAARPAGRRGYARDRERCGRCTAIRRPTAASTAGPRGRSGPGWPTSAGSSSGCPPGGTRVCREDDPAVTLVVELVAVLLEAGLRCTTPGADRRCGGAGLTPVPGLRRRRRLLARARPDERGAGPRRRRRCAVQRR